MCWLFILFGAEEAGNMEKSNFTDQGLAFSLKGGQIHHEYFKSFPISQNYFILSVGVQTQENCPPVINSLFSGSIWFMYNSLQINYLMTTIYI